MSRGGGYQEGGGHELKTDEHCKERETIEGEVINKF